MNQKSKSLTVAQLRIDSVDRPLDGVFGLAYEELRALAKTAVRSGRGSSVSPTTLINEVWIKLSNNTRDGLSPLHLRHIVARAMRQVLVDLARRNGRQMRGGGHIPISFDETLHSMATVRPGLEFLVLDEALSRLASISPRQASLVEARFFAGFTWLELAENFQISESTVMREWRSARAWLAREVRQAPDPDAPLPSTPAPATPQADKEG